MSDGAVLAAASTVAKAAPLTEFQSLQSRRRSRTCAEPPPLTAGPSASLEKSATITIRSTGRRCAIQRLRRAQRWACAWLANSEAAATARTMGTWSSMCIRATGTTASGSLPTRLVNAPSSRACGSFSSITIRTSLGICPRRSSPVCCSRASISRIQILERALTPCRSWMLLGSTRRGLFMATSTSGSSSLGPKSFSSWTSRWAWMAGPRRARAGFVASARVARAAAALRSRPPLARRRCASAATRPACTDLTSHSALSRSSSRRAPS
mmetsp:Transcript_147279/g.473105  ORF Transcript_147279/g.473105 Transcript_147279/m.473105 type:complete len:268 (-) Transcript_147279:884-1687(-)